MLEWVEVMMMTENVKFNKNKKKGGFTTVELIVTVVILMILASGLIFGIVKWVEYTNFKQQNEYARTIFVAAQNQLTEYSDGGKLEEFAAKLPKDGDGKYAHRIEDVTALTDGEGKHYESIYEVWPESAAKTNGEAYRDTICYINVTAADYQAYLSGTASEEATVLYELLSSYLYDMSILNAALCVEFTPEEGQVFSVLYSNRADSFAYTDVDGSVNITDRSVAYRKANMVGYYGVDTLYRATSSKAEKPSITDVRLNNEDTLNLSFSLGKISSAAQQLTYEINVYDSSNKKLLFKLLLDGTKIKEKKYQEAIPCPVYRYTYKADGVSVDETLEMGNYSVLAWIEKSESSKNGTIRVVLDTADLAANSTLYYNAYPDVAKAHVDTTTLDFNALINTYTIRRFGVSDEDIYCTIQGAGDYYKTTAKKQSNAENASFGSRQSGTSGGESTASYTIKNARHLYNLRYMEDFTDSQRQGDYEGLQTAERMSYLLDENLDWDEFVASGALYESGVAVSGGDSTEDGVIRETGVAFPSIRRLRSRSEFVSNSSKPYVISGLTMTEDGNLHAKMYASISKKSSETEGIVKGSVGLFLINEGHIKNVTLDAVGVSGKNKVGAFCAINSGLLSDLTVADSDTSRKSQVTGVDYVGGIFGCQEIDDEALAELKYDGLTNRAHISGKTYVGGITGYLSAGKKQEISISGCKNYGQLSVVDTAEGKDGKNETVGAADAMYIGGIAGYALVDKTGNDKNSGVLLITGCTSSPQYTLSEIKQIVDDEQILSASLKGLYVGGIVGYNDGGDLVNCNTVKESAAKEGYIIGYRFVGGIVGYNARANNSESSVLDGNVTGFLSSKNSINAAHVIGDSYVGGVVGCNALPKDNGNKKEIEPDRKMSDKVAVQNWTNQGIVVARSNYAGGIAGFNSGSLSNCVSDVDNNETVKAVSESGSLQGDYVGGIAGYNSGMISSDKTRSVICYVAGTNYLGGIAGYNAISGVIKAYEVGGGYVVGKGCFVGGYVGLNASINLLSSTTLKANPNEVSGTYCVGGTLGANMAAVGADGSLAYMANFQNDNFLGILKAEAFAGGFMGYNVLLKDSGLESGDNDRIRDAANAAIRSFEAIPVPGNASDGSNLTGAEDILKNILTDEKLEVSDTDLTISGKAGVSGGSQSKFGGLTARIYVGGVIGYNEESTKVWIQSVTNMTPVTATASIKNENEQKERLDADKFTYSYAGGIIGKVSKQMILSECRNQDVGDVTAQGTYLGGLCEINEGKIYNCYVSSIGTNNRDYVGGIAGLNKNEINGTVFEDQTVTGQNVVGGVAAENFGQILNTTLQNAKITAVSDTGGIAGYSAKSGEIYVKEKNQIFITATGSNVGGIIGKNEGTVSPNIEIKQDVSVVSDAEVSGSVKGGSFVGGFIGYNETSDKIILKFHNTAAVTAENGDAGGIIGKSDSGQITDCTNANNVLASNSGNAGGIIGVNGGTITRCTSSDDSDGGEILGNISAPNGTCGGIAGINNGTIESCGVNSDQLSFIGKTSGGGISGHNIGDIKSCYVGGITITNPADASKSVLGGITGMNEGSVLNCNAGTKEHWVDLKANASNVSMGGLVGVNNGMVAGGDTYSTAWAKLSFLQTNQAYYGNLGGIAGNNTGTIRVCEFNGLVEGTSNNPQLSPEYNPNTDFETNGSVIYGYGGIAGVNGDSGASSSGKIEDCFVNTAKITGLGDANNIANIGGVAGVNGVGASISGISFGTGSDFKVVFTSSIDQVKNATASVYVGTNGSTTAYAHAGGVAGLNSGSISNIGFDEKSASYDEEFDKTGVIVEDYRGHAGGIAGHNRRTGVTENVVTGKRWLVFAQKNAQDNGCGGIVGYQAFDNTMNRCINRATVVKMDKNSNGVGGIVGRMETATGASFTVSNCINYGTILGVQRVGGIVGVWKYYGGIISDCKNYGDISSSGDGAGGIVGQFYSMSTTAANIVRCENHGYISGSNSGGIAGYGKDNCYVLIQKCVNTGLIDAKDTNGGILGALSNITSGSAIISCNNYGYGYNSNTLNGIVSEKAAAIKVTNCFGIAATSYPIVKDSGNHSVTASYYLQTDSTTSNKGKGEAAVIGTVSGTDKFKLTISSTGEIVGLPGFPTDPLKAFDKSTLTDKALIAMGSAKDNVRYQVFDKDNDYFDATIKGNIDELEAPKTITYTDNNSASYKLTWSAVENASYYKYSAVFYDASGNPLKTIEDAIVYDSSVVLPVGDINGKVIDHIKFTVSGGATAMDNDGKPYEVTAHKKELEFKVPRVLPSPKYHLELVTTNNGLKYRAYLDSDSRDEYIQFFMDVKGIDEAAAVNLLSSVTINVRIGNSNMSMDAATGKSEGVYDGSDSNIMISAYASCKDYTSSAKPMRESQAYKEGTFKGTGVAQVSLSPNKNDSVGFMGITANTLSYQLKIKGISERILYMRSELVAVDKSLGVPVVVSSSQLRTSDTTQDYVATTLGSLPENLLNGAYEQLMVRSYPALMSNNVVYMGHTVDISDINVSERTGLSWEELLELWVTVDNGVSKDETDNKLITEADGKRSLAAGFVLELASDGTYTLYYNTLLAAIGSNYTNPTGMSYQVFYSKLDATRSTVSMPVIHVNDMARDGSDGDPNSETMEITWDLENYRNDEGKSNYTVGAVYDYIITGTTLDNKTVQIRAGVFTTEKDKENVLKLDTGTWNYDKVLISISRRGTADKNGMTEIFPSGATKECSLKVRFSQITRPEISLHKDSSGVVQKNSLIYDVTWNNVPANERLPENDVTKSDLAGYEVTVESASLGVKTWTFPADEEMLAKDKLTVMLDLNSYGRGETIAVSVRALAKSGEKINYRNGSKGVVRELTLPSRLDVPTTKNLTLEPEYSMTSSMTLEEFETSGIKLHMSEDSGIQQGKYQMAVAVFDEPDSNTEDTSKVLNSGDGTEPGYWNSGAIETIFGKESGQPMNGDLTDSEYILKLDDAYAGKWLKIALRSTSESNVSSEWSDEDATEDGTVNYRWLRIPRIQVETPELKQDQIRLYYDGEGNPATGGTDLDLRVDQRTLTFLTVNNVDQYQLQIIRTAKMDEVNDPVNQYTVSYMDWIYLEKSGEGYNVFYLTSDPGIILAKDSTQPVCHMNKDACFIGYASKDAKVRLPYTGTIHDEAYDKDYQTASFLQLTSDASGETQVTIILPDAEDIIGNGSVKTVLFTSQVSVQARISESLSENYADSMVNNWYRTVNGGSEIVTLTDYADAPNITLQGLEISEREHTAYELSVSARNWLVYRFEILDGTGNIIATRYVSAYGVGTSDIETLALLSDADFAGYGGHMVNIYAAAIIKGQKNSSGVAGGLSQWTEAISMMFPELKLVKPEVTVADGIQTAKLIAPDLTETEASVRTKTYTWTGDKKAGSYNLIINGQVFNTADVTNDKVTSLVASANVEAGASNGALNAPETQTPASPDTQTSGPADTHTPETADTQQTTETQTGQQSDTQPPVQMDSQLPTQTEAQLLADVTLEIQVTGDMVIYKLTVPDSKQDIDIPGYAKTGFSFLVTGSAYLEIVPVPLDDNYYSEAYTVPE